MRPLLEHLPVPPDASWSMLNRRLPDAIPFQWHHHPEFELTLTLNSRGQRFIGDHVGNYDHGDLVLVGPNLPHTWASREKLDPAEPHMALVFWFRKEWIEGLIDGTVEFRPIERLIAGASTGLAFGNGLGRALAANFQVIYAQPPAQRLMGLLDILLRIADAGDSQPLSTRAPQPVGGSRLRIDRVLLHLHQHYPEPLHLAEVAEIASLSVSGLHRMFRKHTQASISDYLIGLRIGEACSRLSGTNQPIQHIADEVGYASLANFNRQFRRLRGMSPREYRSSFSR
ncbi:helix-turn-helix domain-containing protein [Mesorhizobium sp. A556]